MLPFKPAELMQMSDPKQSSNYLAIQVCMKSFSFACKNISDSFALPQKSYSCLTATIPGFNTRSISFACKNISDSIALPQQSYSCLTASIPGLNAGREYDRNRNSFFCLQKIFLSYSFNTLSGFICNMNLNSNA